MPTSLINFVANGTVTTNTQANINTVGNLTNLNVDGVSNLNAVSNVRITGGSNGQAIITNGNGVLSFGNVGTGNGTVTQINTSGSGLGFNLGGGPITTTGTIALTIPTAANLRSSLTIGNVANLNLNGNGSLYLSGNGSFSVPPGTYSNSNVANYLPTYTGNLSAGNANISGLTTTANANITNTLVATTGNITTLNANTGNFSGNITTLNANLGNLARANFFQGDGGLLTNINANFANFAGNVTNSAQPNITSVGTLTGLGVNGNIVAANITANTGVFTGNANGLTNIPGGNVTGQVANALVAGTVYTNAQPNITSVGNLTGLTVNGIGTFTQANLIGNSSTTSLKFINAQELVTVNANGANANINYDISTQSMVYYTGNATGNVTLNFRGDGTTTLNTLMPSNTSMTVAFLMTNGATPYYVAQHQIDGANITPVWLGNVAPNSGDANSIDAYTYTIIKIGTSNYKVLAAITQYK